MEVIVILLAAGVILGRFWAGWHRKRDQRRAQCEAEGHDWGLVFNVLDNPHWPTRRCHRCGAQQCFTRCVCGRVVNRETHELLDQEPRC